MFQKIQAAIQFLSFLFMDVENGKSGTNMRNGRNRLKAKETMVLLKYVKNPEEFSKSKGSFWIFLYIERGHRSII